MYVPISLIVGSIVFVPLLIIALVKFKSVALAILLSAGFAVGATLGLFFSLLAADALVPPNDVDVRNALIFVFGSAGSIGGAAIAMWLLRKAVGGRNWEQR